jgi:hypothetical protein
MNSYSDEDDMKLGRGNKYTSEKTERGRPRGMNNIDWYWY